MSKINPHTGKENTQTLQAAQVGLTGYDEQDQDKFRNKVTSGKRDLSPFKFKQAQEMAYYEYQRYPLAKRMIEILTDFTTGDGLEVKVKIKQRTDKGDVDTEKKNAQMVWDRFWKNPANNMEAEFHIMVQDKFLAGEGVFPVSVNEANGDVIIGYIDPGYIKDVKTLPFNQRIITDLILPKDAANDLTLKVIRYDLFDETGLKSNAKSETYGKLIGDAFYFRNNYIMSQTRGYSELLEYLDWLDGFEQFLFAVLEGFKARNAHFYDVTMQGKSQEDLDKQIIAPPGQGEVKLHNEKVTWDVKTPDLKAVDATDATKLIKNFITGSKGYPDMWFGDASDSNLATAQVMTVPTMQMLKRKQNGVKEMLKMMCLFVMQQAQDHDSLKLEQNEYIDIEISMMNLDRKDSSVLGSAFVQFTTALKVAVSSNWITNETAKKVVDGILTMLGIEVDPNETVEMIEEKNGREIEEDILSDTPNINKYLNNGDNETED